MCALRFCFDACQGHHKLRYMVEHGCGYITVHLLVLRGCHSGYRLCALQCTHLLQGARSPPVATRSSPVDSALRRCGGVQDPGFRKRWKFLFLSVRPSTYWWVTASLVKDGPKKKTDLFRRRATTSRFFQGFFMFFPCVSPLQHGGKGTAERKKTLSKDLARL